jgi:hypothetical protein
MNLMKGKLTNLPQFFSLASLYLLLSLVTFSASGQTVKVLQEGNLFGVQFLDREDRVVKIIQPVYEDVAMYVKTQIGGVDLGKGYLSCRFWSDTEYVEVPIDPNDPEKVVVEVIVNDKKAYIENRPIMVKQKGKWGLIKEDGSVIRPIEYNDMKDMQGFKWEGITEERLPLMLLQKDKELTLIDAFDIPVIAPQWFPPYMAGLKRKVDAMELFYFGNYLLVNEGGTMADTLIKVPAVKAKENGKMVVKEPAYSYEVYIYKRGKFNVINLATGKKLWEKSKTNLEIVFKDNAGNPYFESLNPRIPKSVNAYQSNIGLGITPAQIEFVGWD